MSLHHIPVHMTLATLHDHDQKMIIDKLDETISSFQSETLELVSIGSFMTHALYLQPVLNTYLHDMSIKVNEVLDTIDNNRKGNRYLPYHWIPHITISRKLNEDQNKKAYTYLLHSFEVMNIKVTRIALSKSHPYEDLYIWDL